MRLIDADALFKDLEEQGIPFNNEINTAILIAQTIDAVPVVRCGECKYLMANGICNMFADGNIKPSASDFCSYGERKDDD